LIEAANRRIKLTNPEIDKKTGKPKPIAKKKSMSEFLKERDV